MPKRSFIIIVSLIITILTVSGTIVDPVGHLPMVSGMISGENPTTDSLSSHPGLGTDPEDETGSGTPEQFTSCFIQTPISFTKGTFHLMEYLSQAWRPPRF
jgi:hypothetical protein